MQTTNSHWLGTSNHELVYNFETSLQRFLKLGYPERRSVQLAVYVTFRLAGMPHEWAWADACELVPTTDPKE